MNREMVYTAVATAVFGVSVWFAWASPLFALFKLLAGWWP